MASNLRSDPSLRLRKSLLTAVKNTTIALAIGYPDLSAIVSTVINQSGRALEGFGAMIAVYLCISLSVAMFMNWYNRRVSLVVAK
jgi:general L-amino acid transport system permease protein